MNLKFLINNGVHHNIFMIQTIGQVSLDSFDLTFSNGKLIRFRADELSTAHKKKRFVVRFYNK